MKKIMTVVALLISATVFGQANKTTTPTFLHPNYTPVPFVRVGQMLNILNAYPGTLLDTVTNTGSVYLYTADAGTPLVAVDTFVPYPVIGAGSISFVVTGTKISGTPAGNISLEQSADGVNWGPCRQSASVYMDTATITNTSTIAYTWDKQVKYALYYRIKITGAGTQATSWKAYYILNKQYYYTAAN